MRPVVFALRGHSPCIALALLAVGLAACAPSTSIVWEGRSPDHRVPVEIWASRQAQWVQVGEVMHPPFAGVSSMGVVFSPDSREFAYPALTDSGWVVVRTAVDDSVGVASREVWDGVGAVVFGSGGRLAYAAERDTLWFVVEEDSVGPGFLEVLAHSLVFSRNGSTLAYVSRSDAGVHAVVGGDVGLPFDAVGSIAMSWDGSRTAFAVRDGDLARVVVDGVAGETWLAVREVMISSDGENVAFAGRSEQGWHPVVDGTTGTPHAQVRNLGMDAAGRVYFVANDGAGEFVVRGEECGPVSPSIGRVVLSGGGDRLAYIADSSSGSRLIIDGQAIAEAPTISEIAFSDDGVVIGYVAEYEDSPVVVVDEDEFPLEFVVGGSLVINRDGSRWACLGAAKSGGDIHLIVDGTTAQRTIDWGEFMNSLVSSPFHLLEDDEREAYFRTWVRAEVVLAGDW